MSPWRPFSDRQGRGPVLSLPHPNIQRCRGRKGWEGEAGGQEENPGDMMFRRQEFKVFQSDDDDDEERRRRTRGKRRRSGEKKEGDTVTLPIVRVRQLRHREAT